MSLEAAEGFTDNWAYLKAELNWLERLLMVAVARQRKENRDVDRLAQSRADRASSYWWKGVISVDGKIAYDEHRKPVSAKGGTYQQQLQSRVQVSQQQGVMLALPHLCDRLGLTLFEKNLVLMSLAPEINRRYARLYRYLQSDDPRCVTDLPTVDLALRLFCRNDQEWRTARQHLTSASPLLTHQCLQLLIAPSETWLSASMKLAEPLTNYLLTEQPTVVDLEQLLQILPAESTPVGLAANPVVLSSALVPGVGVGLSAGVAASTSPTPLIRQTRPRLTWADLVLPEPLLQSLQYLQQRLMAQQQVDQTWGFEMHQLSLGSMAVLAGPLGTGKASAAEAIAQAHQTDLTWLDLATMPADGYGALVQALQAQPPPVLLIKSAQLWLGRTTALPQSTLQHFMEQRRRQPVMTLLSLTHLQAIRPAWRRQLTVLTFALPDRLMRHQLWQQAFPAATPLDRSIDWAGLAQHLPVSGGVIQAIAREAALTAAVANAPQVTMPHLLQAIDRAGYRLKWPPAQPQGARRSQSRSRSRRRSP